MGGEIQNPGYFVERLHSIWGNHVALNLRVNQADI